MIKPLLSSGLLVLLAALPPSQALLNARPGTSDIQAPFEGTVFYELSDESFAFTGQMHVTSRVTPKGPISIRVNLDGVSGIGEEKGIRYNVVGRDEVTAPFATSITGDFDFSIVPADGFVLSCILRVRLGLTFSASGNLTDVNIVQLTVVH